MFWCSNVSQLSRILKGLDCCFDPGCFKSRNNLICVETTFQCYKNSQVLVSWFKLVYFSSQNLSQLLYPRILKANNGSFTLLHNDKGARFGVDIDVPPRGETSWGNHQNPLPSCSLLTRPSSEQNGNIDLPCTTYHDYDAPVQCNTCKTKTSLLLWNCWDIEKSTTYKLPMHGHWSRDFGVA